MKLYDNKILSLSGFYEIFSDLFETPMADWLNAISSFKSEFESKIPNDKIITFNKSDLILKGVEPKHFYLTGFDMPCWVSNQNSSKKIMILASEPLRNEESWGESDKYETISINTPFSYHRCNIETENKPKEKENYWDLINGVVNDYNAIIYITDIRKLWFAGWEHYSMYNKTNLHLDIFFKELEFFQPDLIIVFGSTTLKFLKNNLNQQIDLTKKALSKDIKLIYNDEKKYSILPLVHPSSSANGYRDRFFDKNEVFQKGLDKNEMYKRIIQKFII